MVHSDGLIALDSPARFIEEIERFNQTQPFAAHIKRKAEAQENHNEGMHV